MSLTLLYASTISQSSPPALPPPVVDPGVFVFVGAVLSAGPPAGSGPLGSTVQLSTTGAVVELSTTGAIVQLSTTGAEVQLTTTGS